jgi:hypothetical protein
LPIDGIADCRLSIENQSTDCQSKIGNRKSAIRSRQSKIVNRKSTMKKAHSSGNGNQMQHLIREGKSASKALQAQIDRAVALADKELGIGQVGSRQVEELSTDHLPTSPSARLSTGPDFSMPGAVRTAGPQSLTPNPQSLIPMTSPGGLPVAPTHAIPPTPPPEPISVAD